MRTILRALFLTALGGALVVAGARTTSPADASRMFQMKRIQINSVDMPLTNYGEFGQSEAGTAGAYWPKGSGEPYIFGAGIWIGAIVGGDTLVSVGYNTVGGGNDYCPGPPAHWRDHVTDKNSHPEDRLLYSDDVADLTLWPADVTKYADLDVWCEYNDLAPDYHTWQPGTRPIGLHVYQHAFAWNAPLNRNIVFIQYRFINVSTDTIREMYVGHAADDDVGYADDDLVGCDVSRSLGYTFSPTQEAGWTSKPPYYIGVRFLRGPFADQTVVLPRPGQPDTTILPGQRLPLTSFNRCTRNYDANDDIQRYMMLAGYDITTKLYDPWVGVIDTKPEDKRMVLGCGPFTMAPGDTEEFVIAVMFSNGDTGGKDYLLGEGDVAKLMFDNDWAFPGPPARPSVQVTPGDGQVTVSWANNAETTPDPFYVVMHAVGDTLYRQYDLEGYRLWKSRTGLPTDWEELGEWDIANKVTLLPGDTYIPGLGNIGGTKSNDAGLWYSYVDADVTNGISYYYAVTAYDYNTPGNPANKNQDVWQSLETGYFPLTATPRSEAANLTAPTATVPTRVAGTTTAVRFDTTKGEGISVLAPVAVTGHTYRLAFDRILRGSDGLPAYTYRVLDQTANKAVVGTAVPVPVDLVVGPNQENFWSASFTTPVFDGVALTATIQVNSDELVLPTITASGGYTHKAALRAEAFYTPSPRELIFTTSENKKWAYRGGATLEMVWQRVNDTTLTCKVYDVTDPNNRLVVPYDGACGDGWCFGYRPPFPSATNMTKSVLTTNNSSVWFYVAGVRFLFNNNVLLNDVPAGIRTGDTWQITSTSPVVPYTGNAFGFTTTRASHAAVDEAALKRVRVVPNPYFVRADWDRSKDYSKIAFTHLPDTCTIRIYTLAGDLIRIIEHRGTAELGGTETWDLLTRNDQRAASGIYLYEVSTPNRRHAIGKLAIIR